MSKVLAIETSARAGSVALGDDSGVLCQAEFPSGLQHAAQVLPLIDGLCRRQGWSPADIEHVYVSAGPGSFTGLRIGITLAKTLALAIPIRVVAVPSLRVLVENAPDEARHVLCLLDAKRQQIFTALFERSDSGWAERLSPRLATLRQMLELSPRPLHLLGEGIPFHRQFLGEAAQIEICPEALWRPSAAAVWAVGRALAAAGAFADIDRLAPIYIRPPEAEEKFLAKGIADCRLPIAD